MKVRKTLCLHSLCVVLFFVGMAAGQTDKNIGSGVSGSSSYSDGVYTVRGSGWDIWGTADGFNFDYRTLSGDGAVVARVNSVQYTSDWAKVGVMVRESLNSNAKFAMMAMTPGHGPLFEARACDSCNAIGTSGPYSSAPRWVKIVRSGSTLTGYTSGDGYSWSHVGSYSVPLNSTVLVGLAVTSHNTGAINTSSFANVQFLSGSSSSSTIGVTISPNPITLHTGATQTFSATVTGTTNGSVYWSASGGHISSTGTYTAPSTAGTYYVTAKSVVNTNDKATATVDVSSTTSPISVTISPTADSLQVGQSTGFSAHVYNTSNTGVSWSATGGTISSNGVFTAGKSTGTYSITARSVADSGKSAAATVQISAPTGNRLLTSSSANWLYSAPSGTPVNISYRTRYMSFSITTQEGGWNYPVQFTDASHGYTTFTDAGVYSYRNDTYAVPNPPNGYYPATGYDGHLTVVDTTHRMYYDFFQLRTSGGHPTSTHVGAIVAASLDQSSGHPGTTASQITGGAAGSILPGELDCVTCLNHALSVVVPQTLNQPILGHQAPATWTDGRYSSGIFREGAKIRFDPSIDINSLNASTAVKAIMRALQLYGGAIMDQTSNTAIGFYSSLPSQPDTSGINLIGQHLLIYY